MNTHRSLMVWPITERGLTMTPAAFVIDRGAATIGAECEWAWKRDIGKGTS